MKTLERIKMGPAETRYGLLAQQLGDQIRSGELKPGDRLPSFPELKAKLGISQHTWEHAFGQLEREGLVRREPGRGVFVKESSRVPQTGFVGYLDVYRTYSSHSAYFRQIQDGVRRAASEVGKHIIIIDSVQTFTRWGDLEGLLLCEVGASNRQGLQELLPPELPVVNLLFNDPHYPSVQADDETGVRLLVDHLWELGHRRIARISRSSDSLLQLRHQAYREALLRQGIEPLSEWSYSTEGLGEAYSLFGYQMMQDWLEKGWRETGCTAILAQNDLMAFGVIKALREKGIDVPGEVSVVGFDGVEHVGHDGLNEAYVVPVKLSTIRVPLFDIGAEAMKVVLGVSEQIPAPPVPLQLPVKLVVGESSGPCIATT